MEPRSTHAERMRATVADLERAAKLYGSTILSIVKVKDRIRLALDDVSLGGSPESAASELVRAIKRMEAPSAATLVEAHAALMAAKQNATLALDAATDLDRDTSPGLEARRRAEEVG